MRALHLRQDAAGDEALEGAPQRGAAPAVAAARRRRSQSATAARRTPRGRGKRNRARSAFPDRTMPLPEAFRPISASGGPE